VGILWAASPASPTYDPNGNLLTVTDGKIQTVVGNEETGSPGEGERRSRRGAGAGLLAIDRRPLRGAEDVDGDFSDAGRARVGGEERFDSLHGVGRESPGKGRENLQREPRELPDVFSPCLETGQVLF